MTDLELTQLACHPDYDPQNGQDNNLKGPYSIFQRLIANVPVFEHMLEYIRLWALGGKKDKHSFLVASFLEAHEGLGQVPATMDASLARLLQDIRLAISKDTILVLNSDHGSNMGPKSHWQFESYQELAHPFLFMVIPDAVLASIPGSRRSLLLNQKRLVSQFDVHKTLLNVCEHREQRETVNRVKRGPGASKLQFYSLLQLVSILEQESREGIIIQASASPNQTSTTPAYAYGSVLQPSGMEREELRVYHSLLVVVFVIVIFTCFLLLIGICKV
jgi:hypothetical protein